MKRRPDVIAVVAAEREKWPPEGKIPKRKGFPLAEAEGGVISPLEEGPSGAFVRPLSARELWSMVPSLKVAAKAAHVKRYGAS